MNIIEYILKKLMIYLIFVTGMLILKALMIFIFDLRVTSSIDNTWMALIFFAYPVYRISKSTVDAVLIFYDDGSEKKVGRFAGLLHVLVPKMIEGRPRRVFLINIISKFFQLIIIGALAYSFITNDFSVLHMIAFFIFIVAIGFLILFVRSHREEYLKRNAVQLDKLDSVRAQKGGMSIDSQRRSRFLKTPRMIFICNLIFFILGILTSIFSSWIDFSIASYTLFLIKYIGMLCIFLLPITGGYLMQQTWRSHMYTLKIGIGDYGQEKIEFFKYDGSGDEMNDTRYIIDRVDSLDRGSRYIRVLRAGDFRYIRIPRTMSDDEERILDQSLRRMMEVGNINSFKPLKGEDPI